jgi:ribosome-binding protein aMBF1 (putative translation factor)
MAPHLIKTLAGETLAVMSLDEYEDLCDGADHAKALARIARGEEMLTPDESLALVEAPTPLAFWREKRGYTLVELSEAVGVSEDFIADIERGTCKGEPDLLQRLATALNVSADDLSHP